MNHVMLDLETLGSNPRAPIVAIGAVKFDPIEGTIGDRFYVTVNLAEYDMAMYRQAFVIDPSTVKWWLGQSHAAVQNSFFNTNQLPLDEALSKFSYFMEGQKYELWGNGADFDNVILGYAYQVLGFKRPWGYHMNRCFRTLKNVFPIAPPVRAGVPHDALDDAVYQAVWLCQIYASWPRSE